MSTFLFSFPLFYHRFRSFRLVLPFLCHIYQLVFFFRYVNFEMYKNQEWPNQRIRKIRICSRIELIWIKYPMHLSIYTETDFGICMLVVYIMMKKEKAYVDIITARLFDLFMTLSYSFNYLLSFAILYVVCRCFMHVCMIYVILPSVTLDLSSLCV